MNEFIMALLKTVLTAVIPVCTTYLVSFLKKKSDEAASRTENEKMRELMNQVEEAVVTAVTYTSQTYVDALKKNSDFSKEAQNKALLKSLGVAEKLLSDAAIKALHDLYGDAEKYLTARIEAEVRKQKGSPPSDGT